VLAELEEAYRRVRDDGRASFLLLWGEAGVGKTRLLDEFAARTATRGTRVALGTCVDGLCPPFAPLREVFSALELPPPFESAEELSASGGASEAKRYRAFVAAAAALASTPVPNVVLLDDLHWADFATLEFLAFFARKLENASVLAIATVRSENLERDHARFDALNKLLRSGGRRVNVDPLGREEMQRLVALLLPLESPQRSQQVERISALAEGKPYFAEELVSSALALDGPAPFDAVPLSIRAGILARVERLPRAERDILMQASVIGQTFAPAVLAELAKCSERAVAAALVGARDLQLVRETEGSGLFAFRHALTREVLYRELLQAQRQTIHRELAVLLERAQPPADAGQIAFHWSAAGESERATRAYELAGDHAAARNAHRDAQDAYDRAISLRAEPGADVAALYEKYSRALSIGGNLAQACLYLERSVDAYEARGDRRKAASLCARLARRYFEYARPSDASRAITRSLQLCDGRGAIAFDAYVTIAHFAALQGRLEEADAQLHRAECLPGRPPSSQRRDFHMVRAVVRATTARLRPAFEDYERAVSIAREDGDPEQLTWALSNYASRALATGYTERALGAYHESVELLPIDEFGKIGIFANQGLASACLMSGDIGSARRVHARGRQTLSEMAITQTAQVVMEIRLAYLLDEELPLGRGAIDGAVAIAFESGETQNIGFLSGALAAHLDSIGRTSEAQTLRTRAIAAISSADLSLWLIDQAGAGESRTEREKARALLALAAGDEAHLSARAHLALFDARVARRQRQSALAKSSALRAAKEFQAIGWPWEQAAALEVAGRHAQAREIYLRHGYRRQLRELDSARRRARHRAAGDRLTPREVEVAQLAAGGLGNREIGARLFISERTVETHIAAIFDRFDLTSRRQLAELVAAQSPGDA
jgi:DNA-binding NarL/FixJ family response regulator